MFTGIITDVGIVRSREERGDTRFVIGCGYTAQSIAIGASIACSGCCLTVTDRGTDEENGTWFAVDASAETLSLTTLNKWSEGTRINLERSLKVGDELGGHIVTGHVDGMGVVASVNPEGDSHRVEIDAPAHLAPFIAAKGSITVEGVSLTVNSIDQNRFGLNIIPHSWAVTTLGELSEGSPVNLEIDILARYVARLDEARQKESARG